MVDHEVFTFGALILGLLGLGINFAFLAILEHTRANVLLGVFFGSACAAILTSPIYIDRVNPAHPQLGARLQGSLEAVSLIATACWILELLQQSPAKPKTARVIRVCAFTAIALGVWHVLASFVWPVQRLNDYETSLADPGVLSRPGFWLFAVFWIVMAIPMTVGWATLAWSGIEPTEARRANSYAFAGIFVFTATAAPPVVAAVLLILWMSVGVYGTTQYVAAHAKRGVFLGRFLSPQVTQSVNERGMAATMRPRLAEITVVCADLRGFTSYSEGVPSQAVVDLLAEYYDAVGGAVARHGGTITSYAGDGVLILVGAPMPDPQHSATGVQLACDIHDAVAPVVARWETRVHRLGLGVGVASGKVTVGAIEAETRLEYTAIGTAVNLAARLCGKAAAGEILIDGEAARLARRQDLSSRGEIDIKGFTDPQPVFTLA